jgi:transposase
LVLEKPEKLVGDKAYDSDPLDQEMAALGIELILPHKRNRKKTKTQDGRKLRRYKRRWKVERFFAWIQNYRRIVVPRNMIRITFSFLFIWLVS